MSRLNLNFLNIKSSFKYKVIFFLSAAIHVTFFILFYIMKFMFCLVSMFSAYCIM